MGLFDRLTSLFDWPSATHTHELAINPATGLPMVAGIGSVDVAGNSFGSGSSPHHNDSWTRHDCWGASGSSFDHSTNWRDNWSSSTTGGWNDPRRD